MTGDEKIAKSSQWSFIGRLEKTASPVSGEKITVDE